MIKVKLLDIVDSQPALARLAGQALPVKTAYRLQKTLRKARQELADYYQARDELVKKHGAQKKGVWGVGPKDPGWEKYQAEHKELAEVEVELEIDRFPLDALGEIKISAGDLMLMEWLLAEPAEPE